MNKKWWTDLLPVVLILLAVLFLVYHRRPLKHSQEHEAVGTFVKIDVCATSRREAELNAAFDRAWRYLDKIDKDMNAYDPGSDLGRVNSEDGKSVQVSPDVYRIVSEAVHFHRETRGAFNITVRSLIELWSRAKEINRLPSEEDIRQAMQRTGVDKIRMERAGETYRIACDGCDIDLGGIAQGYAVDGVADIMRQSGFDDFLIDAGGDMYASGKNCRGKPWRIGARHPRDLTEIVDVIEISDQAVTTSGDYEKFFILEGQRYSHIIDPVTGYPQRGTVSTTVIAPTATEADVLSTALMVWGPGEGLDFINALGPGYAALIIAENHEGNLSIHRSEHYSVK
ncbi:MAG: FAD:protein FMN transferase [Candidatus Omnitrophota bacterium]